MRLATKELASELKTINPVSKYLFSLRHFLTGEFTFTKMTLFLLDSVSLKLEHRLFCNRFLEATWKPLSYCGRVYFAISYHQKNFHKWNSAYTLFLIMIIMEGNILCLYHRTWKHIFSWQCFDSEAGNMRKSRFFLNVRNCSFFMGIIFCSSIVLVWIFDTRGVYNFIIKKAKKLVPHFNGVSFLFYRF